MTGILPQDVHSPKNEWTLIAVLRDGGPGQGALAIGRWNGKPVIAMRWNGDDRRPTGNPQSRGLPTWFIVPDEYVDAIFRNGGLDIDQVQMVYSIFAGKPIEAFNGTLIKVHGLEHPYQIRHIERLPFLATRTYIVRVEHTLTLENDNGNLPDPAPLPLQEVTFRFHFPFNYKNDIVLFGTGENGDGKEIIARLPFVLSDIDTLIPGTDGIYSISIPSDSR